MTHPLQGSAAELVWLLPTLPFLGFLINGWLSIRGAMRERVSTHPARVTDAHARHPQFTLVSAVGVGTVLAAFGVALAVFAALVAAPSDAGPFVQTYGSWLPSGDLRVDWAFQVDRLSMVMALIVTGIGALIHLFSVGYMAEDPGYPRYFAYLNLFVFFMLTLVLGASYAVIFVGWEGVGLASYLLIGFWFSETRNADAGKKAFIVNRVGDFGFLIAMFLLWANLGSLDFRDVAARSTELAAGGGLVTAICLFLFLGAAGKSAQMPLYIWLPDAMAGPTPVSALIHAATMVTGGVYLVARSADLFALAPAASLTVVIVGAITAIFAAVIGLKQWDIKKVLAYSTVSQLGMMFVAVGSGAYVAGVFHLVTHAFFKALLFLGAGAVIHALHHAYHEVHDTTSDAQDLRLMGGLRRQMPWTFGLMWAATLAIAGIPVLSGFFSKDEILATVFRQASGSALASASWLGISGAFILWVAYGVLLVTALLTAVYMTRMMLYAFHGPSRVPGAASAHVHDSPWVMRAPLVVLGVLTVVGGWLNLPALLPMGPVAVLEHWLEPVVSRGAGLLSAGSAALSHGTEQGLIGAAVAVAVLGIGLAIWRCRPAAVPAIDAAQPTSGIEYVLANKFFVDEAIQRVIVQPIVKMSRLVLWRGIDVGLLDGVFVRGPGYLTRGIAWAGARLQSGLVGSYVWVIAIAVLALLGLMLVGGTR
ncbi:MAG: NADH-quinone oxidoreductase subunit L [Gemmatimonadaceae bacterium]|nr:NADH-quinone oxidoreductase subunit L [Gemmatimonadaceae bacterium]